MSSLPPLYQRELSGAGLWSAQIGRHKILRITDLHGGANVGMLLYHATNLTERYNMPDTLKGQHIFHLSAPCGIHSDMGRLIAVLEADSCGAHDTVCGASDAAWVKQKYGEKNYQMARNDFYRNAREGFLIELAKWGLGKKDIVPNINFFSKVYADNDGHLHYVPNHSKAGSVVELRFAMDTLVVLNQCRHPFDPAPEYEPRPVRLEVLNAPPISAEHPAFQFRAENLRAWENTETHYLLKNP